MNSNLVMQKGLRYIDGYGDLWTATRKPWVRLQIWEMQAEDGSSHLFFSDGRKVRDYHRPQTFLIWFKTKPYKFEFHKRGDKSHITREWTKDDQDEERLRARIIDLKEGYSYIDKMGRTHSITEIDKETGRATSYRDGPGWLLSGKMFRHIDTSYDLLGLWLIERPLKREHYGEWKINKPGNVPNLILSKDINSLNLKKSTISLLRREGKVNSILELARMSEGEALRIYNLGRTKLEEIRTALNEMGLSFGMKIEGN